MSIPLRVLAGQVGLLLALSGCLSESYDHEISQGRAGSGSEPFLEQEQGYDNE